MIRLIGLALAALLVVGPARGEPALFDAQGYRAARYRAPIDRDPVPARRIALPAALTLAAGRDAILIDVTPAEGGVRDAVSGRWRLAEAHQTLPGALWFPETGRASPDPVLWRGLVGRLGALRRAHPGVPIVVFCRADCWMSWNAARRLAGGGMGGVWWLAEGIDGWHDAGQPLVNAVPAR